MIASYLELMQQQDLFVDESGWTSFEPEGTDAHHHHMGGWGVDPILLNYDHWEDAVESIPERGKRPAEGDGAGGPE